MPSPLPDTVAVMKGADSRTVGKACRNIASQLREAGIETPELDARLLVCHCCGLTHEELAARPERSLGAAEARELARLVRRRLDREPVSRIVGKREFHGLDFTLGPTTLDPRSDTETLVDAVIELARAGAHKSGLRILDIGTGSGCILVSLLRALPDAQGTGTDICATALAVARNNAAAHGIAPRAAFMHTRWAKGVDGGFDFVVSNPPYIPSSGIGALQPEVSRYDPHAALDGGPDGLDAFRELASSVPPLLRPGGWLIVEVGAGQHDAVLAMFTSGQAGSIFEEFRVWKDLSGTVRCVGGKRSPTTN